MNGDTGAAASAHGVRPESWYFDGWRFDARDGRLARNGTEVWLRPKTAGVLLALVARADEVVAKSEILEAAWGSAAAGDDVLAVCVNELRRILGDDSHRPRFIATAHRRGYRFVAPVSTAPPVMGRAGQDVYGRERELATLRGWWDAARARRRVVAFVAGERGIGRTALVRAFVAEVRAGGAAVIGEGRCVDRAAGGEPYSPFLDALDGMSRGPGGHRVHEVLRHEAPSWLLQLPGLIDDEESAYLRARVADRSGHVSLGRMLREFSDATSVLADDVPMLLVCEDLHAADRASLGLVASLAEGDAAVRVLLVVTYREPDGPAGRRVVGLVRELQARGAAELLELGPLDAPSARAYLRDRLGDDAEPALVAELARRSEGNPLRLATLVEQARSRNDPLRRRGRREARSGEGA